MLAAGSSVSTSVAYIAQLDIDVTSRQSNTFTSVVYMKTRFVPFMQAAEVTYPHLLCIWHSFIFIYAAGNTFTIVAYW